MTLRLFSAPKSCAFREITKKCSIDLTPQVGLSWRKITWEVTWGARVLVWLKSKEKKSKSFNQIFQEPNMSWSVLILKKSKIFISPLLLLLRSYSSLLSIFQIKHQWSNWSPKWITSLSWFYYLSDWQSRPEGPSRPSLDSFPRLQTIKKDWSLIEDQWQEADVDDLRIGSLTASSQLSFCRFTHGLSIDQALLSLNHLIKKALALLLADTQAKGLIRLS